MGAAFFGRIVENNIKLATAIGTSLFLVGMLTAFEAVTHNSLIGLYLGYGVMLGLGTGIIYISPVKTMMMWFPKHKAVAAALPIIGFGLGSSFCTVLHDLLVSRCAVHEMFGPLTMCYLPLMVIGSMLLKKPEGTVQKIQDKFEFKTLLKDGFFWRMWLFMLINISAGLCLIPLAKQMMTEVNYSAGIISWVLIAMGLMNGAGRFVFAAGSDMLDRRLNILNIIIVLSISAMIVAFHLPWVALPLVVIPACYGAGFSTIPAIVYDHYGISRVSTIHGIVLSAWGFAGLIGNQLSLAAMSVDGLTGVVILVIVLHVINLINVSTVRSLR